MLLICDNVVCVLRVEVRVRPFGDLIELIIVVKLRL